MPNDLWEPRISGEVLRRARTSEGLTLRELADKCGQFGRRVDYSNISKAERSGRGIGPRRLAILFLALPGLDPAELIKDYTADRQAHMEALIKRARASGASGGAAA
jgi:transcriptional regulator with XRE-family HTH domain